MLKYLATPSDRDEVRKFCVGSEKVVLSNRYPSVQVHETVLAGVKSLINCQKSHKVIFKSMLSSVIPDVRLWGENNAEYMRMNHGDVLNACKGNVF